MLRILLAPGARRGCPTIELLMQHLLLLLLHLIISFDSALLLLIIVQQIVIVVDWDRTSQWRAMNYADRQRWKRVFILRRGGRLLVLFLLLEVVRDHPGFWKYRLTISALVI